MELADLTNPSKIVTGIFEQLPEMILPVPVKDIALALDISEVAPLYTSGYVGGLIVDEGVSEGVILVSANDSEKRKRFTIGHELGHFLIPWHTLDSNLRFNCSARQMTVSDIKSKDSYLRKEAEANRFSAELLMPEALFQHDMRKMAEPSLEEVFSMAKKYDVSKEACLIRYVSLQDEPSAVVFSKDGIVRYCFKHNDFPYLNVKKGIPLPKSGLSSDAKILSGGITEAVEVDSETWLAENHQRVPGSLLEQTAKLSAGYQITLLFTEYDEEEDEVDCEPSF